MGTEILKSFGNLQSELEQARNSLKGVDENIKRLIGRDPSELPPRPVIKRGIINEEKGRPRIIRGRNFIHENEEPPVKRRNMSGISVFKRLSDRPVHHEEEHHPGLQKQMISKVIVTPKEVPSRQEALAAQNKDEKSRARNRRMFGALLGTLQRFQQEETKLKQKEDKRAQVEKKIEEHEIKEKQEIKKERQELFLNRRKKQAEIKMIELKMIRMREYTAWEERQKPRMNFIMTKAKPHIYFLPRRINDANKALLESSKGEVEKIIEKKKQDVFNELKNIEDRMKRNFENRGYTKILKEAEGAETGMDHSEEAEQENDVDPEHESHFDEDGNAVLAEPVTNIESTEEQDTTMVDEKPNPEQQEQNGAFEEIAPNISETCESNDNHEINSAETNVVSDIPLNEDTETFEMQENVIEKEATANDINPPDPQMSEF